MLQPHFTGIFQTYVPWHPGAVALAEFFTEAHNPLADKAWSIIDRNFDA
jgi:hypothetical protein